MDSVERFRKGAEIFEKARKIEDRAARARFLDEACHDAAMRHEVEGLLANDETPFAVGLRGALEGWLEGEEPKALAGYRILRLVAEGGMGAVYEAEQQRPRRRVALKLMKPVFAGPDARRRFDFEAEVLARLQHPGIAQIFEAGAADTPGGSRPYIAMEYVDGVPITAFGARLGPRERLDLLARVCDAVAHAHYCGVIHRDLKPSNILVQQDGAPKVLDFGIARLLTSDATSLHTSEGSVLGTLGYMSPEQAAGESSLVDVRSDVYSLGVLAYEMLAGRPPHLLEGKPLAGALRALLEDEPPPLDAIDRLWRGDVAAMVGKAMASEPGRRYASAAAFAEDLRRYLRDEPVTARHPTALRQVRRFFRRHKALSAGILTLAVALVGWLAFALHAARKEGELRAQSDRRAEDALHATYRFQIAAAAAALREADAPGAARMLAAAEPRFRDWAWRYLAAETDQSATFLPVPPCGAFALSADGTRFAFASAEGKVTVLDPVTGATLLAPFDAPATTALEIVGDRLATGHSDGAIRIWEGGKSRDLPGVDGKVEHLDATPDGSVLAATWTARGPQPRARVFDTRTGAVTADLSCGYLSPRAPSLSRDGSRIAVPRFDTDINAFSLPAATPLAGFKGHRNDVRKATWHPDGRRLATAALDRTIRVWDEGREVLRLTGHAGFVGALAFGGDVLASGASDATIRLWDAEGTCTAVLPGHTSEVEALAFQGERLVSYGRDGLRTWLPAQRSRLRTFRGHTSYAYAVAFSADGTRLVSVAWDKTLRVWDAATGQELAREELPAAPRSVVVVGDKALAAGQWRGVQGIDLRTGERVTAKCSERETLAVAASPDGRLVAMGEMICDATTLEPLRALPLGDRRAAAFSSDSKWVATLAENSPCSVWDVATGELEWQVPGRGFFAAAFHPSGTLALGNADGDVRLFDVAARKEVAVFPAHRGRVLVLTYSPDGLWLVTGGDDNTIRFWDAATHDRILDLSGHDDYVHGLAFSRDGRRLASSSGDSTIRIWSTVPWSERLRSGGAPGAGK